jgi:predicted metal-dependent hydrolase
MPFSKTFFPTPEELNASCTKPLHPHAEEGIRLFNEGKYFVAHESLEDAWHLEPDPDRRLYQGILQAGIAYMHARDGNAKGVFSMYERCRVWLWPWPDHCRTIDVGQIKTDLQKMVDEVERLGPDNLAELDKSLFTKIKRV